MSMMDTMSQPDAQAQQPDPAAAAPDNSAPPQQMFARLSEGGDLQGQFDKVMKLTSSQLWEKGMSDLVNEQLLQDDSDPAAVIGKFVSFILEMTNAAFNAKQQAPEPIVVVGVAEQMADQMTDIALNNETVAPEDADETSEAAALIALSLFLEKMANQIQAEDSEEYKQIIRQIIQNSPGAADLANEAQDDVADVQVPDQPADNGAPPANDAQQPPQSGMAAAMGGQ